MAKRIMVVDDSRVVRAEMEKMLEGSDMEICEFCRSGEEALENTTHRECPGDTYIPQHCNRRRLLPPP